MASDDLVETFGETLQDPPSGEERRAGGGRRSGKPSNFCGPERRAGTDRRVLHDRRAGSDRRGGPDRRQGLLRRQQDQQILQKRIEEGELTLEEIEFIRAIDHYKQKFNRPFPAWSEVLAVVKELGYTKDSLS